MSVHRIRLVGPWDFTWREALESGDDSDGLEIRPTKSGNTQMPCDWQALFGAAAGCATFSRRFHRPTNLDAREQVVIVLTGVGGEGTISLNGTVMSEFTSSAGSVETNVTDRLMAFNVLEVCVRFSPALESQSPGGLFAPVVLEIRAP